MKDILFEAIGTRFHITIEDEDFDDKTESLIRDFVSDFEKRFSRFLPTSEVNQFREASAGRYPISKELSVLLEQAQKLRALTKGRYNPAVGKLLELAGYDQEYSFQEKEGVKSFVLPEWSLDGEELTLDGPLVFDLGGIAKGFCLDRVADILKVAHYKYFLVEAGGDMVGTTKADGSGFRIALEWPGEPEKSFGIVELQDQALAVSGTSKRTWKNWHHIVDPQERVPVETLLSCVAVSDTAFAADCATSGFFLKAKESEYKDIAKAFQTEYVVLQNDGTLRVSEAWPGELF